jgi:hypothetical protein
MLEKICIYCRELVAPPFPKEHVIPEAFGRFRNNLTLDCVCGVCNKFFGRELELFLTRDSVEALLRVRYGLRAKSGNRELGKSRLTIRVTSPGDWNGARLTAERDATGTTITGRPMPQVGFRKLDESKREWFLEEELEGIKSWERYRTGTETFIVGSPDEAVQRLADKLNKLGVVFKERGGAEKRRELVEIFAQPVLDDVIFRGVGKIAFNFLAYLIGSHFVLRSEFDTIRAYIRHGTNPGAPVVAITNVRQGADEVYDRDGTHQIVVERDRLNDRRICRVTLFDHLTYEVLFSEVSTIWYPLNGGRIFDLKRKAISDVLQ